MTRAEVLQAWFDAHARGDVAGAQALVADDLRVDVPGASLQGFDAFMRWYRDRAEREGASFRYVVEDLRLGPTGQ